MNALITSVADNIFKQTILLSDHLKSKTTAEITDLLHDCKDQRTHEEFTVRTAAQMLEANCEFVLSERAES